MKLPTSVLRLYVILSAGFSILGLSSLVEGYIIWAGFFRNAVALYQYYVRDSVSLMIDWLLPSFIPSPPDYLVDILVIWTASFAVFRLFVTFEPKYSTIFGYHRHAWYFYPLVFLLGPLCPIYFKIWTDKRTTKERRMAENELELNGADTGIPGARLTKLGKVALRKRIEGADSWRIEANAVHKTFAVYYGAALALFILALFVNYQLLIYGR